MLSSITPITVHYVSYGSQDAQSQHILNKYVSQAALSNCITPATDVSVRLHHAYKGRPCTMLLSMATRTAFFNSFLLEVELEAGVIMGLI